MAAYPRCGAGRRGGSRVSGAAVTGYRPQRMTLSLPSVHLRAIVCEADGTLVADVGAPTPDEPTLLALDRVRRCGLLVAVVYDGDDSVGRRLGEALGPIDLALAPDPDECTYGRADEVRPRFVHRTCASLGVLPAACAVVAGRRRLLDAATWAGAATVMVPTDATPPFEVRAQRRVAADLWSALDALRIPTFVGSAP